MAAMKAMDKQKESDGAVRFAAEGGKAHESASQQYSEMYSNPFVVDDEGGGDDAGSEGISESARSRSSCDSVGSANSLSAMASDHLAALAAVARRSEQ